MEFQVFPYEGLKRSRYYAEMHCASMHLGKPIFKCRAYSCGRHLTSTRKAMIEHQKRIHEGRKPGIDRVMMKWDEKERLERLVNEAFPQVIFPPPRRRYTGF